jgi:mRNA interferase MazF
LPPKFARPSFFSIPADDDERALVTLIPHTTACRSTRFEVNVDTGFLKAGAFDTQQIITTSQAKLIRRLGTLSQEQLEQIEMGVRMWLSLPRN